MSLARDDANLDQSPDANERLADEDLIAESLAPSAEKLEAIRRKYGYPQAWYDDDSRPF